MNTQNHPTCFSSSHSTFQLSSLLRSRKMWLWHSTLSRLFHFRTDSKDSTMNLSYCIGVISFSYFFLWFCYIENEFLSQMISSSFLCESIPFFHWWKIRYMVVGGLSIAGGKVESRNVKKGVKESAATGKVKYKRFTIKILIWFEEHFKEEKDSSTCPRGTFDLLVFMDTRWKSFNIFFLKFFYFSGICQQAIMKYNQFWIPLTSFQ